MRILSVAVMALAIGACGKGSGLGSQSQPILSGDTCAVWHDQLSCQADTKDECHWFGTMIACPVEADAGFTCPTGACMGPISSGDGGTGVGSVDGGVVSGVLAGCACPNGGVCVEQIGGPAQPTGSTDPITCDVKPSSCTATDVCQCFDSIGGRCYQDPNVTGLCICDNGIR